jgi:hypothetical protein
MSSRDSLAAMVVACCLFFGLSGQAAGQGAVTCPATIPGSVHTFERISVYNGNPGGQEYELAPDESSVRKGKVTQRWKLSGYRSMNIFLRCRYRGTAAVLTRDLPAAIQSCVFRFSMDSKGKIFGKPEMECR